MSDDGLSWATKFVLFLIFTGVGAIGTGAVSTLRMIRAADMPLWTRRDQWGRKEHGFLNWWGTLLALWVVFEIVLFVLVPSILAAYGMLSGMWTDAG